MMVGKEDTVAGLRERESFENGVSVGGEFAFTMGVAALCKEAVREGSFKGSYVLVEVKGVLDGVELKRVLDEVGMREEHPDKIVVGGPGSSLIRH